MGGRIDVTNQEVENLERRIIDLEGVRIYSPNILDYTLFFVSFPLYHHPLT